MARARSFAPQNGVSGVVRAPSPHRTTPNYSPLKERPWAWPRFCPVRLARLIMGGKIEESRAAPPQGRTPEFSQEVHAGVKSVGPAWCRPKLPDSPIRPPRVGGRPPRPPWWPPRPPCSNLSRYLTTPGRRSPQGTTPDFAPPPTTRYAGPTRSSPPARSSPRTLVSRRPPRRPTR